MQQTYFNILYIITKTMPNKLIQMTFANVGGIWRRVDSQEPNPPTLAEVLKEINIIVDDDTQFCRIKRYHDKYTETIEYRAYGGKTTITFNTY